MASCVECNIKMGYSETNASRNHDGLCIACYVKSLVKTKINAANNAKTLASNSQIIGDAVANNKVEIKSGYYNLGSGVVDFLD